MYLARQIDMFLFRDIALFVEDPTSLVCASQSIYSLVNDKDFEYEWFSRWHSIHCPHRPWQYAAVTWRHLNGATAEQLVKWMLEYTEWRQLPRSLTALSISAVKPSTAAQKAAKLPRDRQRHHCTNEGRSGVFPACLHSLSTIRDAKKLLRKGRAVDALVKLCPNPGALLFPYVAKAQNTRLLQQLMTAMESHDMHPRRSRPGGGSCYPVSWFSRSATHRYFPTQLIACYQALAVGNPHLLYSLLFQSTGWVFHHMTHRLLQFAARHSNAAGIKAVLGWGPPHKVQIRPHHLTMAAGRTDPWAAEAVQQLLEVLQSQHQLKPNSIRGAYLAACETGNQAVLQLLLGYAATAPKQHFPVLLQAAAATENLEVLQRLFDLQKSGRSSSNHSSRSSNDLQQNENQRCIAAAPSGFADTSARFDWACFTPQQILAALVAALPGSKLPYQWQLCSPNSIDNEHREYDELRAPATGYAHHSDKTQQQLAIADFIWQKLVVSPGRQAELAKHLRRSSSTSASTNVGQMLKLWKIPAPYAEFSARYSWLHHNICQLVPHIQDGLALLIQACAPVEQAADAGHFQQALQMHHWFIKGEGVMQTAHAPTPLLASTLGGHYRRAAAAGDAAAIAQIDKLAAFCSCMFDKGALEANATAIVAAAPPTGSVFKGPRHPPPRLPGLETPFVMNHMTSGIRGRATTALELWAELDLPSGMLTALASDRAVQLGIAIGKKQQLASIHAAAEALQAESTTLPLNLKAVEAAAAAAFGSPEARAAAPKSGVMQMLTSWITPQQQQQQVAGSAAAEMLQRMAEQLDQCNKAHGIANYMQDDEVKNTVTGVSNAVCAVVHQQLRTKSKTPGGLGPLPLWQQCFLVAAAHAGVEAFRFRLRHNPGEYLAAGMHSAVSAACAGSSGSSQFVSLAANNRCTSSSNSSSSGGNSVLQQLFNSPEFVSMPPTQSDMIVPSPWAAGVAAAAVECCDVGLLQWSWAEANKQKVWGDAPGVSAIPWLGYCTPISNSRTRHPQQQQRDMQELQQWQHSRTLDWSACTTAQQQQWFAAGPKFARSAAEIALLLLSAPDLHDRNRPDVLSQWLKSAIRPASSQPDLERAKAVVAAVAAAPVIPTGAQVLEREAFRQVVLSGDVDLIAVVLCWADRLEVLPEDDNNVGDQAAAEGILIEAGWVPGMQGADGQPLPVLIPGEEDEAEDV